MPKIDNQAFVKSIENATLQIIMDEQIKMDAACLYIERDSKKNCPVDQGILRASINHEVALEADTIVGTVGSNEEHAPYVHQGTGIYAKDGNGRKTPWGYTAKAGKHKGFHWTHGQKPNPFLEKSRDQNKENVLKALGD